MTATTPGLAEPTPKAETPPGRPPARVVVVGGGPGGYEAALVARRSGAEVTLVESTGLGGAAVLTDVVPSKTLIATAEWMTIAERAPELGIRITGLPLDSAVSGHEVDLGRVNARVVELATAQSADIRTRLEHEGVRIVEGSGRLDGPQRVVVQHGAQGGTQTSSADGGTQTFDADVILLATGATPRVLPEAAPDGERILTWTQLYGLTESKTE